MGLFNWNLKSKINQLEGEEQSNFSKVVSDKATSIISELSGKGQYEKRKLADNVIAFSNSAGGTGASTLITNVAYTLMDKGLKVLLIDLDITRPIIHTFFGIQQDLEKTDLVSYLLGQAPLNEAIDTSKPINLLYANNRNLQDEINCNDQAAIINFEALIKKVRQYYDVVLVDCPMRVDTMLCNTMLYEADTIYLVWDEGIGSIINTERLRRNMALSGIDAFTKMKIILNKRTSVHFSDFPIKKLNLELVEVLPFSIEIIDNSLKGQIFCEKGSSPEKNAAEFARKIQVLSDKILKIGGYVE